MDLSNKHVVVVGAGKSGLAAARLARRAGARVTVNDRKPPSEAGALVEEAAALGVELSLGAHPEALFAGADLIVLSPGIPPLPVVDAAEARGTRVIPEVELAAAFLRGTLIGITGSNGKSTVTTLVGAMAQASSRPSFAGGNLGDALALAVGTEAGERGIVVAELSSFQLERIVQMRCEVAACLNVSDDHLDRHGTFAAYAAAKGRIFLTQRAGDHAVVRDGDELCLGLARAGAGTVHTFGGAHGEVRVDGQDILDEETGDRFALSRLRIRGGHNIDNACAAILCARLGGVPRTAIEDALSAFTGLPHRMVLVRELDGVRYFDDSKATNVGASVAALEGLRGDVERVVLIAGGVDKGGSYEPLRARMEQLGRGLVLIGEATPLLEQAFEGSPLPMERAADMDDAVATARAMAERGDVVLLAPACASFDMFRSYAHRGDEMQRAVNALAPDAETDS